MKSAEEAAVPEEIEGIFENAEVLRALAKRPNAAALYWLSSKGERVVLESSSSSSLPKARHLMALKKNSNLLFQQGWISLESSLK